MPCLPSLQRIWHVGHNLKTRGISSEAQAFQTSISELQTGCLLQDSASAQSLRLRPAERSQSRSPPPTLFTTVASIPTYDGRLLSSRGDTMASLGEDLLGVVNKLQD